MWKRQAVLFREQAKGQHRRTSGKKPEVRQNA